MLQIRRARPGLRPPGTRTSGSPSPRTSYCKTLGRISPPGASAERSKDRPHRLGHLPRMVEIADVGARNLGERGTGFPLDPFPTSPPARGSPRVSVPRTGEQRAGRRHRLEPRGGAPSVRTGASARRPTQERRSLPPARSLARERGRCVVSRLAPPHRAFHRAGLAGDLRGGDGRRIGFRLGGPYKTRR